VRWCLDHLKRYAWMQQQILEPNQQSWWIYGIHKDKCRKNTWNGENIMGKTINIWKLSMPLVPPLNRVTGFKVFLWHVPELSWFVNSGMLLVVPCSIILLWRIVGNWCSKCRFWGHRKQRWCWGGWNLSRVGWVLRWAIVNVEVTVRPGGWEKAPLIPSKKGVIFHCFRWFSTNLWWNWCY